MRDNPSEVRRRAWDTRRERYGSRGHAGVYRQAATCVRCAELQQEIEGLRMRLQDQRLAESVSRETSPAKRSCSRSDEHEQ